MKSENISEKVLKLAVKALTSFDKGDHLDHIIDDLRKCNEGKIVTDILFNYFRNCALINHLISLPGANNNSSRRKTPPKFQRILKIAITQAKFQTGIEEHVIVDVAVHHAKKKYGKSVGGFINATLRRILSEDLDLIKKNAPENVKFNIPEVVLRRWNEVFTKAEIANFAKVFSKKAPLTFRVTDRVNQDFKDELSSIRCNRVLMPEWGDEYSFYESIEPKLLFQKDWLEKGSIYIQDISTISPCLLYTPSPNDVIYDLCSAPGGKSLLLRERAISGSLIASDQSFARQKRTSQNLKDDEKSVNSHVIVASAFNPPFKEESGDCVFLDVPCSNSGVVRRRPDALWNFSEKKLKELLNIQRIILKNSAKLVKIGGSLIYSTCSIENDENSKQVENFLKKNPEFKLIKERQLLPSSIHDGGYAALLVREDS